MNRHRLPVLAALLPLLLLQAAWPLGTGDLATDFTLPKHGSSQTVQLKNYAGNVIVLDFFAYWCPPCQASSPDVEENIQKYYKQKGGNPNGVPVQLISLNIESSNPSQTDTFIQNGALELVLDDLSGQAYNQYSLGAIPLFVIINGASNTTKYKQWEILYKDAGYAGSSAFKAIIDTVALSGNTTTTTAAAAVTVSAGSDVTLSSSATSATLSGSASSSTGSISTYLWTLASGSGATIVSPNSASTLVTGLTSGTYVFRLTATNSSGGSNTDDVILTVGALTTASTSSSTSTTSNSTGYKPAAAGEGGGCLLK